MSTQMLYPRQYPAPNLKHLGSDNHLSDTDLKCLNWRNQLIEIDQDETILMIELTGWLEQYPQYQVHSGLHTMRQYRDLVVPALEAVNRTNSEQEANRVYHIFEDLKDKYQRSHKTSPTFLDAMAGYVIALVKQTAPLLHVLKSPVSDKYFALGN